MWSTVRLTLSVALLICAVLVKNSTSLRCGKCGDAHSLDWCDEQEYCRNGEVCFLTISYSSRYHWGHSSSGEDKRYTGGCTEEHRCGDEERHGWLIGGTHSEGRTCCSSGDMCNVLGTSGASITEPSSPATPQFSKPDATTQTTVVPTTQSSVAPTATPFRLSEGVECDVCSGPTCGVTGYNQMIKCPDEFPYCMNVIQTSASGNKLITKRCAMIDECKRDWIDKSALNPTCLSFDPAEIYTSPIECTYCCETSGCNKQIVPPKETLVI